MTGSQTYSKVPEVTLGFWIIKILATTLGETGGDSVTMTWLKADRANVGWSVLLVYDCPLRGAACYA